jgi:hypothetical protein
LSGVAFLWIGFRVKRGDWIFAGFLYLVLCLILPFYAMYFLMLNPTMQGFIYLILVVAWPLSIAHAFACRKEYLRSLDKLLAEKPVNFDDYRQQVLDGYAPPDLPQPPIQQPSEQSAPPEPENKGRKIDV